MIELTIPEATPSLNTLLRGHWTRQHKTRRRWHMLVKVARLAAKVFTPPKFKRARVTIERTGARTLDHDNLAGSAKFLIDGLRHEGLIADDSPEHVQVQYHQIIDRTLRQTRVTIEEQP